MFGQIAPGANFGHIAPGAIFGLCSRVLENEQMQTHQLFDFKAGVPANAGLGESPGWLFLNRGKNLNGTKQDAYRCLPPGRNPGCGGPR